MKTLFINCTSKDTSRTLILANHILNKYIKEYDEVDLINTPINPIDNNTFKIKYDNLSKGNYNHPSLRNAKLLKEAELIIIAIPVWNLSYPASFKAFLDDAILTNYTFKYGPFGNIVSLTNTKKVIVVSTSGGPYMKKYTYDYIKSISHLFLNTYNITLFKAENLDIFKGCVEKILSKTISKIDRYFSTHPIR